MASRALIISPLVESRLPLLQLMSQSALFREVLSVHNLDEAKQCFKENAKFDYLFMSNSFGEQEIAQFIERAKSASACSECAFVLVLKSNDRTNNVVANHLLVGIHSFLSEPLSLQNIEESAKLAAAVQLQSSGVRMKAATGLLLTEVLDGAVEKVSAEEGGPNLWDRVQDSCKRFKELTGNSVSTLVVKDLSNLAPSKRLPEYKGVSNRVRGVFEKKLREHLQFFKKKTPPGSDNSR